MTKRIISMLSVAFFALSFVIASSVWLAIFPEYSDSPLEWMAPGLRLSFRASTSVMKPGGGLSDTGGSGVGLYQMDMVAVEQGSLALLQTYFMEMKGGYYPSVSFGTIEKPGVSDMWLNPKVFDDLSRFNSDNTAAVEMPIQYGGQTVQAVRIESRGVNTKHVYTYDRASGILLYLLTQAPSGTDIHQNILEFLSARYVELPWFNSQRPAWKLTTTSYSGTYTINIPGSYTTPTQMQVKITPTTSSLSWDYFKMTISQYGSIPRDNYNVTGVAQLNGPIWLPEKALDSLNKLQSIDQDPITNVVTSVSYIGELQDGTEAIMLQQTNGTYANQHVYDRKTGRLLYTKQMSPNSLDYNITELSIVGY
ncbi:MULTISPECIES: hypothetical protein [Mesotoga]|uniref:hypothetical protein n=1 Tax=Mesotoga TaxID=1184396 RepID=UPI0002C960D7|nr:MULTISPECIES: hypothetical protein [Mesotoga]CCU84941.1 exported hypothetical protein [Mesotoga infera]MCB1222932.1 hypothetical protein [Mesotoga sp.]HNQ70836.1 hypothetical protein [Mesotoga prima]HNS76960.1 hypothetical protein [Mesotoga prima]HPE54278.1 hypothetical protein [Mesotoga prima]